MTERNLLKCALWAVLIILIGGAVGGLGSHLLGGNTAIAGFLGFATGGALAPLSIRYLFY
jgi:hypothetical protein